MVYCFWSKVSLAARSGFGQNLQALTWCAFEHERSLRIPRLQAWGVSRSKRKDRVDYTADTMAKIKALETYYVLDNAPIAAFKVANLKALRQTFSYTGYWLNHPPGAEKRLVGIR